MKKAIAMRCTKEQFEQIKPKLKGVKFADEGTELNKVKPWIINNFRGNPNLIGSNQNHGSNDFEREVFQEWNEKVFLDACGIETEPTYSLTKEQLRSLTDPKVKEWFPEVFETVLKVGEWYVSDSYLVCKQEGNNCFGFYLPVMEWVEKVSHDLHAHLSAGYVEATESEVFEALKNEAVKRGFVPGAWIKWDSYEGQIKGELYWATGSLCISAPCDIKTTKRPNENFPLMLEGKWAEIIPTKTKAEAEKELNCKIVD